MRMHLHGNICITDDWAEKASSNGSSVDDAGGGSDDASESMDTDSGDTPGEARASKKKKAAVVEEKPAVKKAHLNIVFIGHVGGYLMYYFKKNPMC